MARKQSRSRVQKRERRRRERERQRRQRLVQEMNSFLEQYEIDSFEDFESAIDNPFDNFDVETPQRQFESKDDAVKDMKRRYLTPAERRRRAFLEKHKTSSNKADAILTTLGSDLYKMLKEAYLYDSDNLVDTLMHLPDSVTAKDIEVALKLLENDLREIGGFRQINEDAILEAMELGFSYEEALILTEQDKITTNANQQNIDIAVQDYINSLLAEMNQNSQTREDIRNQYLERIREKV